MMSFQTFGLKNTGHISCCFSMYSIFRKSIYFKEKIEASLTPALAPGASIGKNTVYPVSMVTSQSNRIGPTCLFVSPCALSLMPSQCVTMMLQNDDSVAKGPKYSEYLHK